MKYMKAVIVVLLVIFVVSGHVAASTNDIKEISDTQLQNSSLDVEVGDNGLTFNYDAMEGSVFQHASGLVVVTNVEGNEIDLEFNLNIFFITGDILAEFDIPEGINFIHTLVN